MPATTIAGGVVGGVPGGVPSGKADALHAENTSIARSAADRKVVRSGYLDLMVASPVEAIDQVHAIAERFGGYVTSSHVGGVKEQQAGSITIRVPADRFDAVRSEIRKLARRVESESTTANDVTVQYVDTEATLRNYRAEEASYLEIMKRAGRVKDILEVAEKLSDVRGRIETLEAEFRTLSNQVETTAISVNLHMLPLTQAAWLNWRPVHRLTESLRQGLESVADFFAFVTEVGFQIPAVLLWVGSIVLVIRVGWVLLRRFMKSLRAAPGTSTS
ncbi:MAG TPA: DUF4349 domain-containing protein [Terriglobales bacterium]|nr:DUF4349 domain-containing protein [Terriglobales bacterium]